MPAGHSSAEKAILESDRARCCASRFCPTIQELKVVQKQRIKARRSKLYYLRDRKASEFKV